MQVKINDKTEQRFGVVEVIEINRVNVIDIVIGAEWYP